MSLFDDLQAALILLGGMREADVKEEDIRSQIEARKEGTQIARERTAAEVDMAKAQRELTERLTEGGWKQQTKEREGTQAFQSGESKRTREHEIALQTARLEAEVDKYRYENAEQKDRLRMELESREKIAELQRRLQEKGLSIEWAKLQKMMPWEVEFLLKASAIASAGTTGIEGYATGLTSPEATQKNIDRFNATMAQLAEAAGIKNVPKLQLGQVNYGPGGIPGRNALPAIESRGPAVAPKFDNTLTPGVSTLTGKVVDNNQGLMSIHPKDEFKLGLWSTAIKGIDPKFQSEALKEYETVLPTEPFDGTNNLTPEANAAYRERLKMRLREKTNPYNVVK